MIAPIPCPGPIKLEQYLLAQLSDEESAVLEEHLSHCESCGQSLYELTARDGMATVMRALAEGPGRDGLAAAMRARPSAPGGSEPEAVRALIDRLCLRLPAIVGPPPRPESTAAFDPAARGPSPEDTLEQFDFLAPAAEGGDLGRLGPYRVLRIIGQGGMGVVFEAEDPHLGRRVALKAMKGSLAASATARARFLREARAIAALEHDHIVTVLQAGEDRGVLYLAMPLLKGESLDDRLRHGGRQPVAEALRIAREGAEGLASAHARGLVHRDVKPANLWLEGDRGRVKLLDFGLAKAMDESAGLSQHGAIAGTPQYMSPEQARGGEVAARSDLFSLGCVLYHLLTGRPPFEGSDAMATLLAVATEEPPPPAKLAPEVPRGASDLTMRLLAKAPGERPESAAAVVEAIASLERELADPTRPPRRRVGLVVASAAALGLLAAVVIYVRTGRGTVVVRSDQPDVEIVIDEGPPRGAADPGGDGVEIEVRAGTHSVTVTKRGFEPYQTTVTVGRGERKGVKPTLKPIGPEPPAATLAEPPAARGAEPPATVADTYDEQFSGLMPRPPAIPGVDRWQLETRGSRSFLHGLAWSPDGRRVAICGDDERVRVYDAESLRLLVAWPVPGSRALDWSRDGRRIVSAGYDGMIRLWDADDGTPGPVLTSQPYAATGLAFRPDGRVVAGVAPDGKTVRLWDVATRSAGAVLHHPAAPTDAAWSPDGTTLATACEDGRIRLWDPLAASATRTLSGHAGAVRDVAYTDDGTRLVSAGADRTVRVWDPGRGVEERSWQGGNLAVAVSRDGVVASASHGHPEINLSDLSGVPGPVCRGHRYQFYEQALRFRPDGRVLASVNQDGSLRLWDVKSGAALRTLERLHEEITRIAFDATGEAFATAGPFVDAARIWRVADGSMRRALRIPGTQYITCAAFSPDGREVAAGGAGRPHFDGLPDLTSSFPVQLWDAADGKPGPTLPGHAVGVFAVAYPPDGRRVASSGKDGTIQFWDRTSGAERDRLIWHHPPNLAFSADGARLVTWEWAGFIRSWDLATGGVRFEVALERSRVESLALHPAGKGFATGEDRGVRRRDADTGSVVREYPQSPTYGVAISPDGRLLASSQFDGRITVRGWDGETDARVLRTNYGAMVGLAFGPDSRVLASSGRDGVIRLWDAKSGARLRTIVPLGGDRWAAAEPDGRVRVSDPSAEDELVYLVREKAGGPTRCLSPAEFRALRDGARRK